MSGNRGQGRVRKHSPRSRLLKLDPAPAEERHFPATGRQIVWVAAGRVNFAAAPCGKGLVASGGGWFLDSPRGHPYSAPALLRAHAHDG